MPAAQRAYITEPPYTAIEHGGRVTLRKAHLTAVKKQKKTKKTK
jgi:hypothetical protein